MMDVPLNSWLLFGHAAKHHGSTEIVTRLGSGEVHRYTYADFSVRTQRLMHALDALGIPPGAPVATLAWNHYRHLECYFAIPCTGRVLHTLNLRLSPEDLNYIIGHAGDRAILVDPDQLPLLEKAMDGITCVDKVIVLGDEYEELIDGRPDVYPQPHIDERAPLGICYTSGTTGRPKGSVFTHRSSFLHALATTSAAAFGFGPQDCVLPVVPMFHANTWGVPHAAVAVGSKLVFASGPLDPASLVRLYHDERVTVTAGVPTVWMMIADEIAKQGRPPALRHLFCGGSQPPRGLIERYLREFDLPIVQVWGMTETSPLASISRPKNLMQDWEHDALTDAVRTKAGLPLPGVDVSIRDEAGNEVPWDGTSMGNLHVRGPWIIGSYLHGEGAEKFTPDGWFETGDVAIGTPDGYFVIADRTKDLIKSGGEWISSVDMEGALMSLDGVAEAAVVAIPDPKWDERPLACIVCTDGAVVTLEQVRAHLEARGWAKWQLPDRVEMIDEIPRTGVGKFDKKTLRARFV